MNSAWRGWSACIALAACATGSRTAYVARATDWQVVSTPDNRVEIAYDRSRTRNHTNGVIETWVRVSDPTHALDAKRALSLTHIAYRCKQRQYHTISFIEYDDGGHVLSDFEAMTPTDYMWGNPLLYHEVPPDTEDETALLAVCGYITEKH